MIPTVSIYYTRFTTFVKWFCHYIRPGVNSDHCGERWGLKL